MNSDMDQQLFEGVKCVWIDLDDTLIDFEANSRASLLWLYQSQGLDRWFATAEQWIDSYEAHNKALWADYAAGCVTRDFLRLDRFSHPFIQAGVLQEEALEMSRRFDPLYLDTLAIQKRLIEGALPLLDALHRCGFSIGVLSNGFTEVQHRKIKSAGLAGHIDHVVLSDDIGVNKPDVRLYRHAQTVAGITSPAANLMIGDNLSTDIQGALNAGWRAVWFDRHAQAKESELPKCHHVTRLQQLTDMLS